MIDTEKLLTAKVENYDDLVQWILNARIVLKELGKRKWISTKKDLPKDKEDGITVFAIVSGKPQKNIELKHAVVTAGYFENEGWVVNEYPAWEKPTVEYWMPVPELPDNVKEEIAKYIK